MFPVKADIIATDDYGAYNNIPSHKRIKGKAHSFTVESKNSQMRHYIKTLNQKTKCYAKTSRTLNAPIATPIYRINKGYYFKLFYHQ